MISRYKKGIVVAIALIIAALVASFVVNRTENPYARPLTNRLKAAYHANSWRDSWDTLTGQYDRDVVSLAGGDFVSDGARSDWDALLQDFVADHAGDLVHRNYLKPQ